MSVQTVLKATQINCLVLFGSLVLAGCTIVQAPPAATVAAPAPAQSKPANNDFASLKGNTMSDILAAHKKGLGTVDAPLYRKEQTAIPRGQITNYTAYTRTEQRELNGLFPRLPNPDLCMYVYPHLSGEGSTIPGYTSCFPMYENQSLCAMAG